MGIDEVWEILEIEPTSDKKIIKQAYAKAVKKNHPEEDPEGFQKIHTAYKCALAFASGASMRQMPEIMNLILRPEPALKENQREDTGEEDIPAENDSEEGIRIQKFFNEMKSENDKKLFIFRHKWQWYLRNQKNSGAVEEIRAYMQTGWFLDIMEEPEVLSQLARGIDIYCRDGSRELKEDIRQIYYVDHSDGENEKAHYNVLLHVLKADELRFREREFWQREQKRQKERRQRLEREKEKEEKQKKNRRFLGFCFLWFSSMCLFFVLVMVRMSDIDTEEEKIEKEKQQILIFLQENYPLAEFLEPELSEDEQYLGKRKYFVKDAYSGIDTTVDIMYQDGEMLLGEDFGSQYMQQLAQKEGINCEMGYSHILWDDGLGHCLVVGYYSEEEDVLDYMKTFKTFMESEEVDSAIKNIEGISFYLTTCHNPAAFVLGEGGIPEPILYEAGKLPNPEEMAQDMEQAIWEYYVHMEPWNVEEEAAYGQWLSMYEEKVEEYTAQPVTKDGIAVENLAKNLGVKILIYQNDTDECITLGDLYRMLKKSGAHLVILEDGDGFAVENMENNGFSYEDAHEGVTCSNVLEFFAEE